MIRYLRAKGAGRRSLIRAVLVSIVLAASTPFGSVLAEEVGRAPTLASLDQVLHLVASGLTLEVVGLEAGELRVGSPVTFRFQSERGGYLAVLYVDHNGVGTLLYPSRDPGRALVEAEGLMQIPARGSALELRVGLPVGAETVFAVVTSAPLPLDEFGLGGAEEDVVVLEAVEATAFARELADWVRRQPSASVEGVRADHRIVAAGDAGPQYTSRQIVRYFAMRRSIRKPRLDLNIKFPFDSSSLTVAAKRDLDEVGRALNDPSLVSGSFMLAGHTDDLGDAVYNEALSRERAEAVRRYLVTNHTVTASRLRAKGYGESQPEVEGQTTAARSRNRRVILERLR